MAPQAGHKNPNRMHEVFKALAEPQRIAILRLVHEQELPAGEIASRFKTTRQAISQHLRLLTNAGLLELRRDGTKRLYRVNAEAFGDLRTYLDTFWNQSLSSLKLRVEEEKGTRRGGK
ncbi:MAG: ArsR/SmtB family transcription factor [Xanthobacteraceae bacterium]